MLSKVWRVGILGGRWLEEAKRMSDAMVISFSLQRDERTCGKLQLHVESFVRLPVAV